jgi:GTP-binding protein
VLVVLIDLAVSEGRAPEEQERVLLDELGRYQPDLLERPRVIVGSRADVADRQARWDGRRVSGVTGEGLRELVGAMASLVHEARQAEPVAEGLVIHRPPLEGVRVEQEGAGVFRVIGRAAERAVALSDLTNAEALAYVDHRLKRLGVGKALARAGARAGDTVVIGTFSFDYEPDH